MKSSLTTIQLEPSSKDSFSEFISEVQSKYIYYRNMLTSHQKTSKMLGSKYNQLLLKTEFLTSRLQESNQLLLSLKSRLKTIRAESFHQIKVKTRLVFFSFMPVAVPVQDFRVFLQLLDTFDYLEIPDQVLSQKICDSPAPKATNCLLEELISVSVDCRMKHDLLNAYNIEILNVLHEIEVLDMKISVIEEKLEDFTSKIEVFDGNSKVETQEHEFILDSDELYGLTEGFSDTSTIIFEGKPICSFECCQIF